MSLNLQGVSVIHISDYLGPLRLVLCWENTSCANPDFSGYNSGVTTYDLGLVLDFTSWFLAKPPNVLRFELLPVRWSGTDRLEGSAEVGLSILLTASSAPEDPPTAPDVATKTTPLQAATPPTNGQVTDHRSSGGLPRGRPQLLASPSSALSLKRWFGLYVAVECCWQSGNNSLIEQGSFVALFPCNKKLNRVPMRSLMTYKWNFENNLRW